MLINFRVSNFRSFEDVQTFSMKAGKVRSFSDRLFEKNKVKLLKFMAVYGANASGKSNLVEALEFSQSIIVDGLPANSSNDYCRLSDENKSKATMFEFSIELSGKQFQYGFEVVLSNSSFVSEWLYELTYNDKYKVIFKRDISRGFFSVDKYFKDNSINERLRIYAEDIKLDDSVLFLSSMNKNKDSLYVTNKDLRIYKAVYNWFKFKLSVNSPDRPITNFSSLLDNDSIQEISKMLSFFGTGVSHFTLSAVPLEKLTSSITKELLKDIIDRLVEQKKILEESKIIQKPTLMLRHPIENIIFILELNEDNRPSVKTLQFSHNNTDAVFSLDEESDGTVRLLDLVEVLLTSEAGRVYVIDEINRRLHPLLTYKFIEKYLEFAEKRNIQLIVTTHESKIMDFSLLRKDEINFVNKNDFGRSEIYSLEKFGERFDKRISLAYLKGDYGAIPVFKQTEGDN